MNDLRISITYHTPTTLGRISHAFKADPSDDQAGWFVEAYENEGYDRVLKLTRITARAAEHLSRCIDTVAGAEQGTGQSVYAAVIRQIAQHEKDRTKIKAYWEAQREKAAEVLARIEREEQPNA